MGTEEKRGTHGSRGTEGNTWEQRHRGKHMGTEAQRGTHGNRGTEGTHGNRGTEGNTCMSACDLWHVVASEGRGESIPLGDPRPYL